MVHGDIEICLIVGRQPSHAPSDYTQPDFSLMSKADPTENYLHPVNWTTDKDGTCWVYDGPKHLCNPLGDKRIPHDKDYGSSSNKSYCGNKPLE